MKEQYEGSDEDRRFVASYLELMRSITPYEMFLTRPTRSLAELLNGTAGEIDPEFFLYLVNLADAGIRSEYSKEFELVPPERYFVGTVSGADWGGFHSDKGVGYQNLFRAGFGVLLNSDIFPDRRLRTLELARNYLHDSIHHSTFCSFRRLVRLPYRQSDAKRLMPEVYRYQYGISFRNALGVSYSSPKATYRVPSAINLNLLMDGVGVDAVAALLNRSNASDIIRLKTDADYQVFNEVTMQIKADRPSKWGEGFYFEVVTPARAFVDHWGADGFRKLVLRAMFEGDLVPLKKYWNERHGATDAWDQVLRQPAFIPEDTVDA